MSETNKDNLEARFDAGESVLDYFEAGTVLTTKRLKELTRILNLSALAREAGLNVYTLQTKVRRGSPLSAHETAALVGALKRYHLMTVS
jgi:hypothetical protein